MVLPQVSANAVMVEIAREDNRWPVRVSGFGLEWSGSAWHSIPLKASGGGIKLDSGIMVTVY
jgi:hypothetical protein